MLTETKLKYKNKEGIPAIAAGHHIPERGSWRILKPVIDLKQCIRCRLCWLYCPDTAMGLNKNDYPYSDPRICQGCGVCANVCPVKCIKMERDLHHGA